MATKKTVPKIDVPPKDLSDHIFYGLKLDEEQKIYRDAIYSKDYDVVIADACAGSGKTTLAIATAMLMVEYGMFSGIIYQNAGGVYESKQGFLPGTLADKNKPLFAPLYQAVTRLGYDPMRVIASDDNMGAIKEGTAMITAQSDSYIRGVSFGEADSPVIVILDEVQNLSLPALRTSISRVNKGSKLIAIGEQKQCDMKFPQDSGFQRLISHCKDISWCKICTLSTNYRGRVSALGDEL